jgi:hypothetical protein
MKTRRAFVFTLIGVAALAGLSTPQGASAGPSRPAADLAALRVATNCAAWPAFGALRTTGTYDAGSDGKGTFDETFDTHSGRYVRVTHIGSLEYRDGRDSTEWSGDATGAAHRYDSASARGRAISDAWLARRDWCRADAGGARISFAYVRNEDGFDADVLVAQPPYGQPVKLWIDRRSHLLDRVEERQNENTEIDTYADWRAVGDAILPFEERDEQPEDDGSETYRIRSLVRLTSAPPQTFAPPALPTDVTMLHGAAYARVPYVEEALKPLIPVYLNGVGPFPFVYDTGGHFIISEAVRRRLGVKARFGQARIRSVRIGDAIVWNDVASVSDGNFRSFERGPRPPKGGWLGLDILERFASTFDPRTHTVTLRPLTKPRPEPEGARLPMTFDEDAPFIDCRIDGIAGPCMLDTGNAGPTIVEGYWAAHHGLVARLTRGIDIGGGIAVGRAEVAFGPFRSPHELVDYQPQAYDGSESTSVEAAIFSQGLTDRYVMTLDMARRAAWLAPVPNAPVRPFNRCGIFARKAADGTFLVRRVLPHSPAELAGIRAKMTILRVDGIPAAHLAASDLADLEVGPIGARRTFVVRDGSLTRTVSLRLRELLP